MDGRAVSQWVTQTSRWSPFDRFGSLSGASIVGHLTTPDVLGQPCRSASIRAATHFRPSLLLFSLVTNDDNATANMADVIDIDHNRIVAT